MYIPPCVLSFSPQILPFSLTFSVIILLLSLSLHKPTELGLQDVVDDSEMFIVYTWVLVRIYNGGYRDSEGM